MTLVEQGSVPFLPCSFSPKNQLCRDALVLRKYNSGCNDLTSMQRAETSSLFLDSDDQNCPAKRTWAIEVSVGVIVRCLLRSGEPVHESY